MNGWQWFWTLVGFLVFIIILIFLYFYQPFEDLFTVILTRIAYENIAFWASLVIGIIGFCGYHWRAYRVHIVQQRSVESMVLSSLRGSTFIAILLSGGATLQMVLTLCIDLLRKGYLTGSGFGQNLGAVIILVILTGAFCVIFWLLKIVKSSRQQAATN